MLFHIGITYYKTMNSGHGDYSDYSDHSEFEVNDEALGLTQEVIKNIRYYYYAVPCIEEIHESKDRSGKIADLLRAALKTFRYDYEDNDVEIAMKNPKIEDLTKMLESDDIDMAKCREILEEITKIVPKVPLETIVY